MADERNFHFPIPVLLQEGGLILTAAEKYTTQIGPRLPDGHVAAGRTLATQISAGDAKQKSDAGDRGDLTQEQNASLKVLNQQMNNARETAKKAFKGQDVKLREEFQVGINTPNDLGSVLERARIIAASLKKEANAAALKAKGWLTTDTANLDAAIADLGTTDAAQEAAKSTGATGARNRLANQFFDAVQTVQNAANLQWPDGQSGNDAIRAEFRLGKFPPRGGSGQKPGAPEPPKPPTPPA